MNLRISVENLPENGGKFNLYFNKEDIHVPEIGDNIQATIYIKKNGNLYAVSGKLEYDLNLTCSRCLEPFTTHKKSDFQFEFKKMVTYGTSEIYAREIDKIEDEYLIKNNLIDFEPLFHDQIILSIPMKPLCSEDCRGLCPICGTNLNNSTCEHVEKIKELTLVNPKATNGGLICQFQREDRQKHEERKEERTGK